MSEVSIGKTSFTTRTEATRDVNFSWIGFAYQADTLRQRTAARGEAWPYVRRSRNAHAAATNGGCDEGI